MTEPLFGVPSTPPSPAPADGGDVVPRRKNDRVRTKAAKDREPATTLPVARVSVDVPLPHLDRPFDYLVPAASDTAAQPGVRVKVRFAGQLVNGYLLERVETSAHATKLAYLEKVVSPEPILTPEIARLARAVADRYAGNLSDVLRLAIPPRHARAESRPTPAAALAPAPAIDDGAVRLVPHDAAEAEPTAPPGAAAGTADQTKPPDAGADAPTTGGEGTERAIPQPADVAHGTSTPPTDTDIPPQSAAPTANAGLAKGVPTPNADDPPSVADAGVADVGPVPGADAAGGGAALGGGADVAGVGPALGGGAGVVGGGLASGGEPDGADGEIRPGSHPSPDISEMSDIGHSPRPPAPVLEGGWGEYPAGPAFLHALEEGRAPRAVWAALPGEDWAARLAEVAAVTVRAGRGVVLVVPDARDLERLDRALGVALGAGSHVALNAAAGPSERYKRFLAASRGQARVVAGTRAAMFAPVADLGLVVIWDDGDDLHAEPRAPYPHAREVLLTRSQLAGCAALVGGFARTGEGQLLLETGWAREIVAARDTVRRRSPAIAPTGDDPQLARDPGAVTARLPSLAWDAARKALQANAPVLVQVPRRGYLPSVACAECRTPARCPHCQGPLGLAGARDVPTCHWCGRASAAYECPVCGERRLRASIIGARRTAEELGRAFPGVAVRTSGRDEVLNEVPGKAALVVATPGAEPVAIGGYGAVLLLDTWALLTRADLRAAEEAMRRWFTAAAMAKPARDGGRVVVVADGSLATVQALLRWDPGWFAGRELAERRELGFPPAARFVSLTGRTEAVNDLLAAARLPEEAELLGPVPASDEQERMLVRVPRGRAAELARALHEAAGVRSAKRATLPVRVQVDPAELL